MTCSQTDLVSASDMLVFQHLSLLAHLPRSLYFRICCRQPTCLHLPSPAGSSLCCRICRRQPTCLDLAPQVAPAIWVLGPLAMVRILALPVVERLAGRQVAADPYGIPHPNPPWRLRKSHVAGKLWLGQFGKGTSETCVVGKY